MKFNETPIRYLITHPLMGIYLGNALGMGFWSLLDPCGQDAAVTFSDINDAAAFIRSWDSNPDVKRFTFVPVTPSNGKYATIADCVRAGLSAWEI